MTDHIVKGQLLKTVNVLAVALETKTREDAVAKSSQRRGCGRREVRIVAPIEAKMESQVCRNVSESS